MQNSPFIKNPHLDGNSFTLVGNQTGVLLIHGFTASTAEVRLLANQLHQQGLTVAAPLLAGHLTSPQALNNTPWQAWYDSVETACLQLQQTCNKIIVGGESMGAILALLLASRHPEISGILCYAPALRVKNLCLSPLLALFKPWLVKKGKDDRLAWKGYNVYPLKAAVQLLKLQKTTKRALPRIHQPISIFMGALDETIYPDCGVNILADVSSKQKSIHTMQQSPHCLILADELPEISSMSLAFINSLAD